jgi:alpha-tubulin suppressor-like RCC1 family protein
MTAARLLMATSVLLVGWGVSAATPVMTAGDTWATIVKSDGTVWSWGRFPYGGVESATPVPLSGATNAVAVSASNDHALILAANGTVAGWGNGNRGQLGDGSTGHSGIPVAVKGVGGAGYLGSIGAVAALPATSVALSADGAVFTWGFGGIGALGNGSTADSLYPTRVLLQTGSFLENVLAIAASYESVFALRDDGTVWAWGGGPRGCDPSSSCLLACQVLDPDGAPLNGITGLAGGWRHILALTADGSVYAWGTNDYGQVGNGSSGGSVARPVKVVGQGGAGFLSGVVEIGTGLKFSLARTLDGKVLAWGHNEVGALGIGSSGIGDFRPYPVSVLAPSGGSPLDGIAGVVASKASRSAYAVGSDGAVYGWGSNSNGQLGFAPPPSQSTLPWSGTSRIP